MTRRSLAVTSTTLAMLSAAAIPVLDPTLARLWARAPEGVLDGLRAAMSALEVLLAFPVSKFALGFAIVAAGAVLQFAHRHRALSRALLYVGVTHLAARLSAGMLKNVFLRERPFESGPDFVGEFFAGGSSFPSGHGAHVWSLFFALVVVRPRWCVPLLLVPLFVSVQRVAVGDHFLSDVLASASLSALAALAFALVFRLPLSSTDPLGTYRRSGR